MAFGGIAGTSESGEQTQRESLMPSPLRRPHAPGMDRMGTPMLSDPRIPTAALVLGLAGLIPFAACAVAAHAVPAGQQAGALQALAGYGAVILSFLGGVRWGLVIRMPAEGAVFPHLLLSVAPSILCWAALLLPTRAGLALLAVGFIVMLVLDWRTTLAPAWYRRLRLPLSAGAVLALAAGLLL